MIKPLVKKHNLIMQN